MLSLERKIQMMTSNITIYSEQNALETYNSGQPSGIRKNGGLPVNHSIPEIN